MNVRGCCTGFVSYIHGLSSHTKGMNKTPILEVRGFDDAVLILLWCNNFRASWSCYRSIALVPNRHDARLKPWRRGRWRSGHCSAPTPGRVQERF